MITFTKNKNMCYIASVSAEKALIGCGSPLQFAAKSRHRKVCGFFHGTSYGGVVGRGASPCRFSLRELPDLPHPTALPPDVEVGRQSFNATLETTMGQSTVKLPNKDYFGVSNNILAAWEEERERIYALAFAIECGLCPDDLQNPADDTRYQEWRIAQVITHLLSDIGEISAIKKSYFGEAV